MCGDCVECGGCVGCLSGAFGDGWCGFGRGRWGGDGVVAVAATRDW